MRREKNQLLRLQTMIENDRIITGDNFVQIVQLDLDKLLKDYFDYRDIPNLMIEKEGDEFLIKISFKALRIKKFANIPKT